VIGKPQKKQGLDSKIDQWVDNFRKRQEGEEQVNKALINDVNERQEEVDATLREFEDMLKLYRDGGKEEKKLLKQYE